MNSEKLVVKKNKVYDKLCDRTYCLEFSNLVWDFYFA